MSKTAKRVLKNSFFQTMGAIGITGLNLLLMLGYARILGPESFGLLITAQAKVLVWALLVDLGLSHGLISVLNLAEGKKSAFSRQGFRARDIVLRVLFLRICGAFIGSAVVITMALSHSKFGTGTFFRDIAFLPNLFSFAIQQTAVSFSNYRQRQGLSVISSLAGIFISSALSLYLAYRGFSIPWLLLAQSWGGICTGIMIFSFFSVLSLDRPSESSSRRVERLRSGPWVKKAWRALWIDAWPYALTYAAMMLWSRLDQLATERFLGIGASGQYALAIRLVAVPIFMSASVSLALFPDLQRLGRENPGRISIVLGTLMKVVYRYGIIIIAAALLVLGLIVHPLLPKFSAAIKLLPYFAPGIWSYWMQGFIVNALFGTREFKRTVFVHLVSLGFYLPGLFFLPMFFGLYGIVWSFNIFCLSMFIFSYITARKTKLLPRSFSLFSPFSEEEKALLGRAGFRLTGMKWKH